MSTYVMSDIHGHKKEFDLMLEKINFSSDDELWILGDIIDKGPDSASFLYWCIEEAPDNIHFLLGNHEDMAYSALKETKGVTIPMDAPWSWNDGWNTMSDMIRLFDNDSEKKCEWVNKKMLPWIEELPLYKYIEVNNKPFMLVHAGFEPYMFDDIPDDEKYPSFINGNFDYYARRGYVDVGHGFGKQEAQHMLWERDGWYILCNNAPVDTVFGHTYFSSRRLTDYAYYKNNNFTGGEGKIVHLDNKYGIDCGCARSEKASDEELEAGLYNLGCLRLDDMEEFYVPCFPSW